MGGVLSYSGLSTKIRAMQSRLTTMDQFEEILQLADGLWMVFTNF